MLSSHRLTASWLARITLACASALVVQPVRAADKPSPTPPAKSKPDAILTQAQLRECVAQKERLRADSDAVVKAKAASDAQKAEIASTRSALAEEATTLDRTKADAVAAYNAKIEALNALVDSFQTRATAYNKDVESVQALQEAYAKSCENRRYDDRDLSDIQKKK